MSVTSWSRPSSRSSEESAPSRHSPPRWCPQGLQERDEQTRRLREETLQAQRQFEARLEEETAPLREQKEHLDQLCSRKEELEQLLEDREAELEEVKREHR